ncbi:AfsR/SARP family transcriptional regulator [Wenjunlia tyrosinilytica]|uniref:OmpR/PhoB-type domain-containing protein n=1 Tax=Wenjunlia tyrosinilytica TaxID=1544741 RepID=A0A917ZWJ7_9ACTN|nr:BTAD domain-containing putative transcriptional regulator [Wenjunlia tyrosinilytica]GGO96036.1 hypothetical protein GCM10012280_54640 [Wenjunlia tyrosinilytica]
MISSQLTTTSLRFEILGPVRAWRDGEEVDLGPARQRAVLARLLLSTGQPQTIPDIIAAVWGDELPGNPRNLVHKYVGGLRRALEPATTTSRTSQLLPLNANGYMLRADRRQVDLDNFTRTVSEGITLADIDLATARDRYNTAIGLWQGEAFGQLSGEFFAAERHRLAERLLTAHEDRIAIDLALGGHAEAAIEVTALLTGNPLREHLSVLLMTALYLSGRQADALRVFHDYRRNLVSELGIEPAQELQRVHRQILAGQPVRQITLSTGKTIEPAGRSSARADIGGAGRASKRHNPLCHLGPDISDFTGRERQVTEICSILAEPGDTPPVVVITGMAGVGKSALAIRAAHLMKSRFPGGQFYLNLRGMTSDPVQPAQAFQRLLRLLGSDGSEQVYTDDELGELYRTAVRGRMLTVLDDAADERQVRPLLSGAPTLITSRRRLAGLHGARIIELDTMAAEDALRMLSQIIGSDRTGADPRAAARILDHTEGLPLALRIAGARLVARPHWTLGQFADRLGDRERRLAELAHSDLEVRMALAATLHHLSQESTQAFLNLAAHGAHTFTAADAAGILGTDELEAADIIEELVDLRLVHVEHGQGTGRLAYRLRDLVRLFACGQAAAHQRHPQQPSSRSGPTFRRQGVLQSLQIS